MQTVIDGLSAVVSANFTRPANSLIYPVGAQVSDSLSAPTVITLASMSRLAGLGGRIVGATLVDESAPIKIGTFALWLFDTTRTPNNDGANFAPAVAELRTLVEVIYFTRVHAATPYGVVYEGCDVNGNPITGTKYVTAASTSLFANLTALNNYGSLPSTRYDIRLQVEQD